MQKYTSRNPKSVWSKLNKDRVGKMIKEGKMIKAGFAMIEEAKKTKKWQEAYTSKKKLSIPSDLKEALVKNKKAWRNFKNFANTYQNMYIGWVTEAKREETRKRRLKRVVELAEQNKKLITM